MADLALEVVEQLAERLGRDVLDPDLVPLGVWVGHGDRGLLDVTEHVLVVLDDGARAHLHGLGRLEHGVVVGTEVKVAQAVIGHRAALEQLVQLEHHQAGDRCGRGGDGWNDTASDHLALVSWSRRDVVVARTQVGSRRDKVL